MYPETAQSTAKIHAHKGVSLINEALVFRITKHKLQPVCGAASPQGGVQSPKPDFSTSSRAPLSAKISTNPCERIKSKKEAAGELKPKNTDSASSHGIAPKHSMSNITRLVLPFSCAPQCGHENDSRSLKKEIDLSQCGHFMSGSIAGGHLLPVHFGHWSQSAADHRRRIQCPIQEATPAATVIAMYSI